MHNLLLDDHHNDDSDDDDDGGGGGGDVGGGQMKRPLWLIYVEEILPQANGSRSLIHVVRAASSVFPVFFVFLTVHALVNSVKTF